MRPVIGITACNRTVGSELAQAVMNRYVRAAMQYADVAALLIPALPDLMDAMEVVGRLDAVMLTGSPSNVEPARYGDCDGDGPFDAARDEIALGVVRRMIDNGKPVFGMCRGFQEINVALGGTLRRDTSSSDELLRHHSPEADNLAVMFDHRHPVDLTAGGMLASAVGKDRIIVNSVHYQGVGRLAEGLDVEALAPDGLVEAYAARPNGAPLLAVQWHPEWETDTNPDSQAFFRLLGRAARGEA
jgi:putative glutamine amidotransferase